MQICIPESSALLFIKDVCKKTTLTGHRGHFLTADEFEKWKAEMERAAQEQPQTLFTH